MGLNQKLAQIEADHNRARRNTMADREFVGTVFVDAGIVMIGDPCYTLPDDGSGRENFGDWHTFCDAIATEKETAPGVSKPFSLDETGIVISSGYGDGEYPVYVTRNSDGRVASVTVEFITDEDVDDEDWL